MSDIQLDRTNDSDTSAGVAASARGVIQLNFINRSNDTNNTDILIFQKNSSPSYYDTAVAWTVIHNCGRGSHHPFTYPEATDVAASDSWGNYTQQLTAANGQLFEMVLTPSGDQLKLASTPASSLHEIQIQNSLRQGAINALVYKDGRLLAMKAGISPQQRAAFSFQPTIWIGAVSQIEQGDIINEAILSSVNTEISLLGIRSADIVMTGGGPGTQATPFQFTLENVVYQ